MEKLLKFFIRVFLYVITVCAVCVSLREMLMKHLYAFAMQTNSKLRKTSSVSIIAFFHCFIFSSRNLILRNTYWSKNSYLQFQTTFRISTLARVTWLTGMRKTCVEYQATLHLCHSTIRSLTHIAKKTGNKFWKDKLRWKCLGSKTVHHYTGFSVRYVQYIRSGMMRRCDRKNVPSAETVWLIFRHFVCRGQVEICIQLIPRCWASLNHHHTSLPSISPTAK